MLVQQAGGVSETVEDVPRAFYTGLFSVSQLCPPEIGQGNNGNPHFWEHNLVFAQGSL
jgi:hypothetical protein